MNDNRFEFEKIERPLTWLGFYKGAGGGFRSGGKIKLPPDHALAKKFPDKVATKQEMEERASKMGGAGGGNKPKFNPDGKNATEANLTFDDIKGAPQGVDKEVTRNAVTAAGTPVSASIANGELVFTTNENTGTTMNKAVDPIAAGKLAFRESQKLIADLPDGTLLKAAPVRDATGGARIRTYQKFGFGDMIGGTMYAVKRGDKLIPVDSDFFETHLRPNAKKLPQYKLENTPLTGFALERRRQQNLAKMEKDTITDSDFSDLFSDF